MSETYCYELFQMNPVIAAISDTSLLEKTLNCPCDIIFLLTGDIFNIKNIINTCYENDKKVFIHLDLLKGFSHDSMALKYLKKNIKPTGVISTKTALLKKAKDEGFFTIQRIFMLDSLSVDVGIRAVNTLKPDAVELMPGIIPKVIGKIVDRVNVPLIAGGLIEKKEEVIAGLKAGAMCISTTKQQLWYI